MGRRIISLAIAAAGIAVIAAAIMTISISNEKADPDDSKQVSLGKTMYAANCAFCHGAQLEGQAEWRIRKPDRRLPAPPHDVSGHTWHHSDDALFGIVKNGIAAYAPPGYESNMPAFGNALSDQQIWAVLAFIKSSWPQSIRDSQQRRNDAARK
ncbi:MAG: c-type cytochrome [Rhodospirillales bacterium]|nr:c-type cytochrome [Rhodospirillales bacterium]